VEDRPEDTAPEQDPGPGGPHHHGAGADGVAQLSHQVDVGRPVRAHRIDGDVGEVADVVGGVHLGLVDGAGTEDAQPGHVVHVHGPHLVAAVARHGEHRQLAQQPGQVVQQHRVAAEDQRGPHRQGGHRARLEPGLHPGLAAEVRVGRVDGGVGHAQVHDAAHPGPLGGVDELDAPVDGHVVATVAVAHAHPVRVVEGVDAGEGGGQAVGVSPREGPDVEPVGGLPRVSGEGAHRPTLLPEELGDHRARVAERARDQVSAIHRASVPDIGTDRSTGGTVAAWEPRGP
jgi:hypothetical protein